MSYFDELSVIAENMNHIPSDLYTKHGVKRGLRNEDGSGVLVGLTTVSNVVGYKKTEAGVLPVEGEQHFRGIEIRKLVNDMGPHPRYQFERTAYLLLFGENPTPEQLTRFNEELASMRALPINFVRDVLETCPTRDIMISLSRAVLSMYSLDPKADDLSLPNQIRQGMELIARMPVLVPYAYHILQHAFHEGSLIVHRPDPNLSTAENFLRLLRPNSEYTPTEAETLDLALLLHADHGGGNNSTFVARAVSSTLTDFYSAIAAAIGSLKGPLHGGANLQVVEMMRSLRTWVNNPLSRDEIRDFLFRLLRKEVHDRQGKIYGLGHAVYTKSDPRAGILRDHARALAKEQGREEELAMYELVEQEAPKVFQEYRKEDDVICANVDFYSGFVYECLNIPKQVFTPLFAASRIVGWSAHRIELMSNPVKIMRPAYKHVCKYCKESKACDTDCRFNPNRPKAEEDWRVNLVK